MHKTLAERVKADKEQLKALQTTFSETHTLLHAFSEAVNKATGEDTLVLSKKGTGTDITSDYILLRNAHDTESALFGVAKTASYIVRIGLKERGALKRLFGAAHHVPAIAVKYAYLHNNQDMPRGGKLISLKKMPVHQHSGLNSLMGDIYKQLSGPVRHKLDLSGVNP